MIVVVVCGRRVNNDGMETSGSRHPRLPPHGSTCCRTLVQANCPLAVGYFLHTARALFQRFDGDGGAPPHRYDDVLLSAGHCTFGLLDLS